MKFNHKENGMLGLDRIILITDWDKIIWCGENPQTVLMSRCVLRQALNTLEALDINEVFVTVSNAQPIIFSEERYKGGCLVVAPKDEDHCEQPTL